MKEERKDASKICRRRENYASCGCFLPWTWRHCEVYWNLDLKLLKRSGGQPVALGLELFFCAAPREAL